MTDNNNVSSVPIGEKITYGFGNLAANLMITTRMDLLHIFMTDVVGLTIL